MKTTYELLPSDEEMNKNRVALVTGANSGIGFEVAARIASEGFGKVIIAVRSIEKGRGIPAWRGISSERRWNAHHRPASACP